MSDLFKKRKTIYEKYSPEDLKNLKKPIKKRKAINENSAEEESTIVTVMNQDITEEKKNSRGTVLLMGTSMLINIVLAVLLLMKSESEVNSVKHMNEQIDVLSAEISKAETRMADLENLNDKCTASENQLKTENKNLRTRSENLRARLLSQNGCRQVEEIRKILSSH